LREELQKLDPVRAGERLPDARELRVEAVLELAMTGASHISLFNRLLDYWMSSVPGRAVNNVHALKRR
jgi:hypothetical protein